MCWQQLRNSIVRTASADVTQACHRHLEAACEPKGDELGNGGQEAKTRHRVLLRNITAKSWQASGGARPAKQPKSGTPVRLGTFPIVGTGHLEEAGVNRHSAVRRLPFLPILRTILL